MTVKEENLASLVDLIQRIHPRTIHSYPSALALIASYAMVHGLTCPHVPAVCLGGELMHERQRQLLESVFGSVPFIRYASNELYEVSGQCETRDGLHILAEDFIIEVVDPEGHPVPQGKRGRFLITSLHNFGMPFIRYEPGDEGVLRSDACPCGRGLPLMDAHIGRTCDYLVSATGARVAAMDVDLVRFLPPEVVQYQLVQDSLGLFLLRAVPQNDSSDTTWLSVKQNMAGQLSAQLGAHVNVEVQLVDRIDMNLSGKRLSFISNIGSDGATSGERTVPSGNPRIDTEAP
jgi:phenylacetate-CoA ligase